ncbi:MAG: YciI family protein [Alphaproteobacteria bacterium]|nr:YciI family protein [Alphaproteobacteria bacterium]
MKYMLLIYSDETGYDKSTKADIEKVMAAYGAYGQAMRKAGVYVGADRLKPTGAASTVTLKDGKTKVLDGPYAETKEQLGGYYIVDVPDLDQAIVWASRCPAAAHGKIEVRPIWEM